MHKIEQTNPGRLDVEFGGEINADEMKSFLDELVQKSAGFKNGVMLYRINDDFELPTFGALMVELSRLPEMFRLLAKFHRTAVLCNTAWVRRIGEIEGYLFPGLEVKAYPTAQKDEAEKWLTGG
ncbi:MAG: STAS/SEC14 domain-containing protein [Gammaproteobacteria bacterium]